MNDVMIQDILIGAVADFPNGEIRPASMPDGTTLAIYNVGILTGNTVECSWHFGTFDVTNGKPTGMPCTVALKTFAVKVIEESVYVEF